MQGGLLRQLLQRLRRKRLRLPFLLPATDESVAAIRRAAEDREERYKLPKILSKCLSEVSSDCASEGDAGEGVRAEGELSS